METSRGAEKSIRSDSEDDWQSESGSEFSYDDETHDDDMEDRTVESQRLIAIGVLQEDDESKAQGSGNGFHQHEEGQEQPSTACDEAVANSIAREEHNAKMRIKEEREAMGRLRPKQTTTIASSEREEKMRTFQARRGVPRSRPVRAVREEEETKQSFSSSKRSLDSASNDGTLSSQRSVSSGIDLDEKTRQRILSRSALRYARPKRSSLQSVSTSASRPSDEKRNLRISPRMSSDTTTERQSSNASRASRPSDEKAAFRRHHPRRARDSAMRSTNAASLPEATVSVTGSNELAPEASIHANDEDRDIENSNLDTTVDIEAEEDEEPEVLPGAFAVSGICDDEDGPGVSGYDSGFENDSQDDHGEELQLDADLETASSTMMETTLTATSTPLTAELYIEEQAVDAVSTKVVTADGEDPETPRKLKKQICGAFFFMLVIAATVMGIFFTRGFGRNTDNASDQEGLPVIVGWDQVGQNLTIEDPYKDGIRFGNAVAISADGNRIAVGLPGLDDSEEGNVKRVGSVQIFDLVDGSNWEPNFEFFGAYSDAELGTNVALSDDGKRVAIGAPSFDSDNSGYVEIYEESDLTGQWELAANFSSGIEGGIFGDAVGFAGDGKVIAIGDKYFDDRGLDDTGAVRIYREINGTWNQMGNTLVGSKKGNRFGWSVSLSKDGNRVAASSLGVSEPGKIQIFDFNGTVWEMIGSSLIGESIRETFGVSIKLSRDGAVLAASATGYSREGQEGDGVGVVRTYRYNGEEWTVYGQPLEGDNRQDAFGSSMSLSQDGSIIAVGGPENGSFCNSCGQVKIFQRTSTTSTTDGARSWESVGSALGKTDIDNGQFGYAVALSETGERVVGAAPFTTFDGFLSRIGQVLVFDSIASIGDSGN